MKINRTGFTAKLAKACAEGNPPVMQLEGPHGLPCVPAKGMQRTVFVFGGVGITPALSLARAAQEASGRKVALPLSTELFHAISCYFRVSQGFGHVLGHLLMALRSRGTGPYAAWSSCNVHLHCWNLTWSSSRAVCSSTATRYWLLLYASCGSDFCIYTSLKEIYNSSTAGNWLFNATKHVKSP